MDKLDARHSPLLSAIRQSPHGEGNPILSQGRVWSEAGAFRFRFEIEFLHTRRVNSLEYSDDGEHAVSDYNILGRKRMTGRSYTLQHRRIFSC